MTPAGTPLKAYCPAPDKQSQQAKKGIEAPKKGVKPPAVGAARYGDDAGPSTFPPSPPPRSAEKVASKEQKSGDYPQSQRKRRKIRKGGATRSATGSVPTSLELTKLPSGKTNIGDWIASSANTQQKPDNTLDANANGTQDSAQVKASASNSASLPQPQPQPEKAPR